MLSEVSCERTLLLTASDAKLQRMSNTLVDAFDSAIAYSIPWHSSPSALA